MGVAKPFRQEQIMKIIRNQQIFTQEELRQELKKQGIEASQETLSRDLRELRLSRTVKGYIETLPQEGGYTFAEIAEEFLTDVRVAQNLLVLRTRPGHANTVAVVLDEEKFKEVIGSIAGDDTILVIAEDNDRALELQRLFLEYVKPSASP